MQEEDKNKTEEEIADKKAKTRGDPIVQLSE